VKEARPGDLDGVRTHVSRGCEKGIRTRKPSARTTTASVLGSRSAVGRSAGRGLGWEVSYPSGWRRRLSVTFRADAGRSTQRCSLGHDGFLRHLTSKPENRPIALCRMGLGQSSQSHIKGNAYKEEVLEVGYLCTKYEAKEAEKSKTTTHL